MMTIGANEIRTKDVDGLGCFGFESDDVEFVTLSANLSFAPDLTKSPFGGGGVG